MAFVHVSNVNEIPKNSSKIVNVNNKSLALFNIEGNFYVIENECRHRGGPLGEGEIHEEEVTCPWHGWVYNLKTGNCLNNPGIKVQTYKVRVEGEKILIEA
ncbi:MAG TPA: nitrite reductase small subunit NirD [Candidatus Nanoarchaeia archaeon]|nr:nitrite reductase small subunit NirD [Candidatus Nanoarchaeia archaeon]